MVKATANFKLCVKCNRSLPLSDFYSNRKWAAQANHDAWCRDCCNRYCTDVESLKQYCYENNRKWEDRFWESAYKKAQYALSTNKTYISTKTKAETKKSIIDAATCRQFFSMMNVKGIYEYTENMNNKNVLAKREDEEQLQKAKYDPVWRGTFTPNEIAAQNATYAEYEKDFDLSNVSMRDYARKVAKASLNADIAENKMRHGEISVSEYKEVQKIFDDLSKSSNFAACARKAGTSTGLSSLGEIIYALEINHELDINPFEFPPDDIDKVYNDYAHLAAAVGSQL